MKESNDRKLDQAILDLNNAIGLIAEVEHDLNMGTCDKSETLANLATAHIDKIQFKIWELEAYKTALYEQYDSIKWIIEDADHERC